MFNIEEGWNFVSFRKPSLATHMTQSRSRQENRASCVSNAMIVDLMSFAGYYWIDKDKK